MTLGLKQYSYDGAGRVTCAAVRMNPAAFGSAPSDACTLGTAGANGPDRISAFSYDNANHLLSVTTGYRTGSPIVAMTKTYTANGLVQTVADGKTNLTTYTYDGFDRLSQTNFPSPTTAGSSSSSDYIAQSYDPNTWDMIQQRRRDGQVVNYAYDARHNLLSKDQPSSSYAYDNLNRLTSATQGGTTVSTAYDSLGRVSSTTGPLGTIGYQYNLAGDRTQMTWPDGFYVNYDWTYAHELSAIRENGATSGAGVLASFAYDSYGRRTSLTRGNSVTTTYQVDGLSRLTSLTNDLAGTANDETLTLAYNPASQIVSRTSNNAAYAWSGLYNVDRAYVANGLDQLTTSGAQSLTYDARGNLTNDGTTTYGYDVDNRLTSTSTGVSLVYDGWNRLYQVTGSSGAVTRFAYDADELIAEYDSAGNLLRRYVHGAADDEPLVWYEGSGVSNRRWLETDNQGSVIAVTDGTGASIITNSYDEYGIPGSNNQGRFQYTGQAWLSELALYNYKARIYSPNLGRFMQTDPAGYVNGPNWYAYVRNDPVNGNDPSGLTLKKEIPNDGTVQEAPETVDVPDIKAPGTDIPTVTPGTAAPTDIVTQFQTLNVNGSPSGIYGDVPALLNGHSSNGAFEVAAVDVTGPRYRVGGLLIQHGPNPLDPDRLELMSAMQVGFLQRLQDTINMIKSGKRNLGRHYYNNFPNDITGAVMPPDPSGYTSYDMVGSAGPNGRGTERLYIGNSNNLMFYTTTHGRGYVQVVGP